MAKIIGEYFLWELQIDLHGFLKKGLSKVFFYEDVKALQCTGSSANIASLVFISQEKATEIRQYLMLTVTFIRVLLLNKKQDGLCNNQVSVIKAF